MCYEENSAFYHTGLGLRFGILPSQARLSHGAASCRQPLHARAGQAGNAAFRQHRARHAGGS